MIKDISVPYIPRDWQKNAKEIVRDNRYTVLVMHRRAGKTVFDVNELIEAAFRCDKPKPQVAYFAPFRDQAKKIAWNSDSGFKTYLKCFGDSVSYNESELRIDLPNGGKIYLLGADNQNAARGMYFDFVVLDEYQDMPSDFLDKVIAPTLIDRGGKAIITGTPKGKDRLHEAYQMALSDEYPDWGGFLKTVDDTELLDRDTLNSAMRSSPEAYEQEYMCSFEAAIKGAFFGKQIEKLRRDNRIIEKEYDPAYPVVAGLDIGLDGTGIWYMQIINGQPIIIDFDYMENKDIPYMANKMMNKNYVYAYIILPHDGNKRQITDKRKTAAGQMRNYGFKVIVAKRVPLLDAVAAGRNLLGRCQITKRCDETRFKFGKGKSTALDALSLYRAVFNEAEGVQNTVEKHDKASHVGSAFRTLAVGLRTDIFHDQFEIKNKHSAHRFIDKQPKARNTWKKFRKGRRR